LIIQASLYLAGTFWFRHFNFYQTEPRKICENGGKLIVFTQQKGVEYTVLPGGQLNGEGWIEDQSCFSGSVAISSYHPILSGLSGNLAFYGFSWSDKPEISPYTSGLGTTKALDISTDGYFTEFPDNSSILLSRIKTVCPQWFSTSMEKEKF